MKPDDDELDLVEWAHNEYNYGENEGWCLPYLSCRKFHYFRRGVSLCGKYTSARKQPDAKSDERWPDDHPLNCKVCQRKKMQK